MKKRLEPKTSYATVDPMVSIRDNLPLIVIIFLSGICLGVVALIAMGAVHISKETAAMTAITTQAEMNKVEIIRGQSDVVDSVLGANAKAPPSPPSMECDVAIVGAGPGGLTMAYRLAPIYGSKLCIFDDRDHVGGKVHSVRYTASSDTRPVWAPTHAEQYRGGDTIMRCMAQEVGSIMVVRGTIGLFYDYRARDVNATGYQCYGNVTPTGPATCAAGYPWEGVLAPNGYTGSSPYGNDLLNPCGTKDWKSCSYTDEYQKILVSASNANTIQTSESFRQYVIRILGQSGGEYYLDQFGLGYMETIDARAMIDFFNYDHAYPYGHVHMHHGGPQAGTWNRIAKLIDGNGTRIILNTKIQSIDRLTTGPNKGNYKLLTSGSSPTTINAKRVVLAFPPTQLNSMSGSTVDTLKATPYVTYSKPTYSCTWNAFFPTQWWAQGYGSTCHFGYCASVKSFNLTGYARENYQAWNFADFSGRETSIDFIQYVATPERKEGHLLRYFYEEEPCIALDAIFASSGAAGIQTELMYRTRLALNAAVGQPIPEPVEAYYSSEIHGYAGIAPGAPFRPADWLQWATEPLMGEKLCFATEGVNMFDSGWQEGAAKVAHNCLRGNVFKDVVRASAITELERCRADIKSGANRYLDNNNKNTGNDICLLLKNEYHMRDLAGYPTCGSPQIYDYPNLTSFTSTSYEPNQDLWANAITTPVYEPMSPNAFNRKHCT
jgi:hypothetical protein